MRPAAKIKKIAALIAACFAAVMLTGCGASLSVYDYTSDGIRYSIYTLSVDNDTVAELERTAAFGPDGNRYTVEEYFYGLFTLFGCEPLGGERTGKEYVVRYRKAHRGGIDLNTGLSFSTSYTENAFIRTYTSVAENPFNGLRAMYDNATPDSAATVMSILKNGYIVRNEFGESSVIYPSVTDAFPYAAAVGPDGLLLNYVWTGSSRMESTGEERYLGDKTTQYVFARYFDDTQGTIGFRYKRAVPYGWYLTAIAAGLTTLVIFVLVTRTKKQKPTLLDRFPYNPEEYRDYEANLPALRK